jgi:hypothetical protein
MSDTATEQSTSRPFCVFDPANGYETRLQSFWQLCFGAAFLIGLAVMAVMVLWAATNTLPAQGGNTGLHGRSTATTYCDPGSPLAPQNC